MMCALVVSSLNLSNPDEGLALCVDMDPVSTVTPVKLRDFRFSGRQSEFGMARIWSPRTTRS
jgi:hypothetical protein